jgi:hypothetical protein
VRPFPDFPSLSRPSSFLVSLCEISPSGNLHMTFIISKTSLYILSVDSSVNFLGYIVLGRFPIKKNMCKFYQNMFLTCLVCSCDILCFNIG